MNNNFALLLPKSSQEYFIDAKNENYKLYIRVTNMRFCLENILHTVLIHIVGTDSNINISDWKNKKLVAKIDSLKDFFPSHISEKLHNIRKYSNKAAHELGHKNLNEETTSMILKDISKICEWTIYSYFVKYGFNTESWIPTLFSTLPPKFRVKILTQYFYFLDKKPSKLNFYHKRLEFYENIRKELMHEAIKNNNQNLIEKLNNYKEFPLSDIIFELIENKKLDTKFFKLKKYLFLIEKFLDKSEKKSSTILLTIEKLSMAYLKNYEFDKAYSFLEDCYQQNFISYSYYIQMYQKLDSLKKELDKFEISKNLENTAKAINILSDNINENEKNLFYLLITSIVIEN